MFWSKLITLCNSNNLSPSKLCEILNFSNATATKWKNGSQPRDTAIAKICDYFNVSYDYFDENNTPATTLSYSGNAEKQEISQLMDKILKNTDDDAKLKQIKMFLNTYVK